MRSTYKWLSLLLILVLIFFLIALAAIYLRSLFSQYSGAGADASLSLPLPVVLPLIAFPLLSLLLAGGLTLRAVLRIRRKEREDGGDEEDGL